MNNLKRLGVFIGLIWILVFTFSCASTMSRTPILDYTNGEFTKLQTHFGDNLLTSWVMNDDLEPDFYSGGMHMLVVMGDSLLIVTTENTILLTGFHVIKCEN